jgi:hypothetical protein
VKAESYDELWLSRTLDDPGVSPGKTMLVSQGFSVSPAEQRDVIIKSEGDPELSRWAADDVCREP